MDKTEIALATVVQNKKGMVEVAPNVNFFDFHATQPKLGAKNIAYIRDLPSVQLKFIGRPEAEWRKVVAQYAPRFQKLQGFVTMTHTFARDIQDCYGMDLPYTLFRNFPNWKNTLEKKRNEFVHIGAIPVKFSNTLAFLSTLQNKTGYKSFFVKRKNYADGTAKNCMHVDAYDFGSKYFLLINENEFVQAGCCFPRKLSLGLMSGQWPVLHQTFTESIAYCQSTGINPCVYLNVDDIVNKLHDYGRYTESHVINRRYYCMEERISDLTKNLGELISRIR